MTARTALRAAGPVLAAAVISLACGVSSEDSPQPIKESARPETTATPNVDSTRMSTTSSPSTTSSTSSSPRPGT